MKNRKILGTTLIIVIIILMGLSIAMLASVSYPKGKREFKSSYYFVVRQAVWFVIGGIVFWITSNFKYTWYKKVASLRIWIDFTCSSPFFKGSERSNQMVFICRI